MEYNNNDQYNEYFDGNIVDNKDCQTYCEKNVDNHKLNYFWYRTTPFSIMHSLICSLKSVNYHQTFIPIFPPSNIAPSVFLNRHPTKC